MEKIPSVFTGEKKMKWRETVKWLRGLGYLFVEDFFFLWGIYPFIPPIAYWKKPKGEAK
jgi:hypothetical protein